MHDPTMGELTIRPAVAADREAIERLLRAADLPTNGVAEILGQAPGDFVVAERARVLVGAAALEVAGRDALLRSVVVRADGRTTGVGRAMVTALLADADRRSFDGVYLLTTTAGDWFPRFGFTRVERSAVPRAIADTWEFKTGCAQTAVAMARKPRNAKAAG